MICFPLSIELKLPNLHSAIDRLILRVFRLGLKAVKKPHSINDTGLSARLRYRTPCSPMNPATLSEGIVFSARSRNHSLLNDVKVPGTIEVTRFPRRDRNSRSELC